MTLENKVYTQVSSPVEEELINESRELVLQYERAIGIPPIFIKLLEEPFKDWMISIEDIKKSGEDKISFGYNICRVQKDITDEDIGDIRDKLNTLMFEVFSDILINNKNTPPPLPPPEENTKE